jgi:hypothetical protein
VPAVWAIRDGVNMRERRRINKNILAPKRNFTRLLFGIIPLNYV